MMFDTKFELLKAYAMNVFETGNYCAFVDFYGSNTVSIALVCTCDTTSVIQSSRDLVVWPFHFISIVPLQS